jgi:methyltransferase
MKLLGVDTSVWYLGLIVVVAAERLVELAISRHNVRRLLARGAVEHGIRDYRYMVLLHTAFLLACPAEVVLLDRPWIPSLAVVMTVIVVGTMALRYWVVATLGDRWSTRVVYPDGEPRIVRGPYRWIRHPNYVAVVLELLALPLIHTAWLTALVFSAANAWILARRIRLEDTVMDDLAAAGHPPGAVRVPADAGNAGRGVP